MRVVLEKNGLTLGDIVPIHISLNINEVMENLKNHTIDAVLGWEFNWPITMALLGYPVRTISTFHNGFCYYGIVYFARDSFIERHRDALAEFTAITMRGWQEAFGNPVEAAKYVTDKWYPPQWYIGKSKELTLEQQIVEIKLRQRYVMHGVGRNFMGMMDPLIWAVGLDTARKHSMISVTTTPAEDYYTMAVLFQMYPQLKGVVSAQN